MSHLVLTIGPAHTMRQAARMMSARRIGAAAVIDPGALAPEASIMVYQAPNTDDQPVCRQPRRQPVRHHRGRHHAGWHDHRDDRRPEHPGLDSAQRTWGWDWLWPHYAEFGYQSEAAFAQAQLAGGGGGFSGFEPTPAYQQNLSGSGNFSAVEYLTPAGYTPVDGLYLPTGSTFDAAPAVQHGSSSGRALPDLVADADPFTGYLLYDPLATPPLQGVWGGTSFVAPQLNAAAALIDQAAGHRTGLWDPAIYRFAASADSPFTPLSASGAGNDNLYFTGTPGQVFNAGSGFGDPDLAKLASDFAG